MKVLVKEELVDMVVEHIAREMDLPVTSFEERDALKNFIIKTIAFYLYELKEYSEAGDESIKKNLKQ
jgi:hypothetical protein